MGNLLKQHQLKKIRFQGDGLILYNPTKSQKKEIKDFIIKHVKQDENNNINGEVSFDSIKFIIRDLTNIGDEIDEYDDETLKTMFKNGDKYLIQLIDSISDLLSDLSEEIYMEQVKTAKMINSYLKIIEGEKDINKLKDRVNKLFKKNKINLTFDDLGNITENNIEQLIGSIKK